MGYGVMPVGFFVGHLAVAGLCPHQQITTILGPAKQGRDGIGCQQDGDAGNDPGRRRVGGGEHLADG